MSANDHHLDGEELVAGSLEPLGSVRWWRNIIRTTESKVAVRGRRSPRWTGRQVFRDEALRRWWLGVLLRDPHRLHMANDIALRHHLEHGGTHRVGIWCRSHRLFEAPE